MPHVCSLYDPIGTKLSCCNSSALALWGGCFPWLLEMVAGDHDQNELPEEVVCREAMEEAGLQVRLPAHLSYFASPGGNESVSTCFADRWDTTTVGGIHGLREESEDIQVMFSPKPSLCYGDLRRD